MKLKLKKLDRRNNGYGTWKYYVDVIFNHSDRNDKNTFYNIREWCWTHWGASKELNSYDHLDLFDGYNCSNPRWCWLNDEYNTRIYLRDDEESVAFTLKWF